jgi:hypothetical protein
LYVPPSTSSANPWFGTPEFVCTPPLSVRAQKYSASVTRPGSFTQRGFHMSRIAWCPGVPNAVESSLSAHR